MDYLTLCKKLGLSYTELAGELGVSRRTLIRWMQADKPILRWAVYGLILHHCGVADSTEYSPTP